MSKRRKRKGPVSCNVEQTKSSQKKQTKKRRESVNILSAGSVLNGRLDLTRDSLVVVDLLQERGRAG
jgi:hypothetical protein